MQAQLKAQEIAPDPVFNAPDMDDQEEQVAAWRAHLTKAKNALASRFYTLLIKPDREAWDGKDKLRLDPPTFTYDNVNKPPVERIFRDIGGKPVREASYHHLLWRTLSEKVVTRQGRRRPPGGRGAAPAVRLRGTATLDQGAARPSPPIAS